MEWRTGTLIVMSVSVSLLIGWDIVVAFFNSVTNNIDTESGIITGWFEVGIWPLAWIWGVLGGHWFMPGIFWIAPTWFGVSALVLSASVLLLLGLWISPLISHSRVRVTLRGFALMLLGILEGWLFFPQ